MEDELREILDAGLAAADPKDAVLRSVSLEGDAALAGGVRFDAQRVFVVAAGKAAGPMAEAAQELFGGRIEAGILVTKDGHDGGPEGFETVFASHPEPDEIQEALGWAARTSEERRVPVLVEIMCEREVNAAMGLSIDKINEYEPILDGTRETAGQIVGGVPDRD